jgi:hypothetical protein
MFLIGGPAYSGTTLLTLLLDQDPVVCLDEPDFHNPAQSHRGLPVLAARFADSRLPQRPAGPLSCAQAVDLMEQCERAISPRVFGMKTCNRTFLEYAEVYRARGYPVVAIVRDIRDALVRRPLPPWIDELRLNAAYRAIWAEREHFDLWIRYEDLVAAPGEVMPKVTRALGLTLPVRERWDAAVVPRQMLKHERHHLLKSGTIAQSRVGLWRTAAVRHSEETARTAVLMGYPTA